VDNVNKWYLPMLQTLIAQDSTVEITPLVVFLVFAVRLVLCIG